MLLTALALLTVIGLTASLATVVRAQGFVVTVTLSGPSNPVLLGGRAVLNATVSGPGEPYTYYWRAGGVAITNSDPSLAVTPPLGTSYYSVFVVDAYGDVSNTAYAAVGVYDFALSTNATTVQILAGDSAPRPVNVTESLVPGSVSFRLPQIALTLTGLPAGAAASFNPTGGSASGFSSLLSIAAPGAAAGTYILVVTGTDATTATGGARTTPLTLEVVSTGPPLQSVIDAVGALNATGTLNRGLANSLDTKLNHAISAMDSSPPRTTLECNQLNAFVNEVESLVAEGVLTQAQADSLLQGPQGVLAVMAAAPCT